MIPAREDLVLAVGATFGSAVYRIKRNGAPVDLTGCEAAMRGFTLQGGQALFAWTSQDGKLQLGGTDGTVTPLATAEDTAAIWATTGLVKKSVPYLGLPAYLVGTWLMDITGPNGLFLRPLQGNLLLIPTFY